MRPTISLAGVAGTAGALVAAGVAAARLNDHRTAVRHRRLAGSVPFGSVHGPRRSVTSTDGLRLNVEVDRGPAEAGLPTIVFVHGWICTLDTWHYQRLALRGQARLVFMELRSHGRSEVSPPERATFDQLADDLAAVIAECADGPVVVVGHSMGGMSILALAERHPDLFGETIVGALLLSTSSGRLAPAGPLLERLTPLLRASSPVIDWGRRLASFTLVERWGVGPHAQQRHAVMMHEMILRAPTEVLFDFHPAVATMNLVGGLTTLGRVPTTVMCGTQDVLTPYEHSRRLVEQIPGARLDGVEGAGHMIPFEGHDQVTAALLDLAGRAT